MKVLQFAFYGSDSEYLPHRHVPNGVVYTGHPRQRHGARLVRAPSSPRSGERVFDYLGGDGREIEWALIRAAYDSVAERAIVPLQDVLGLGSEARMNTPAEPAGNWTWRAPDGCLAPGARGAVEENRDSEREASGPARGERPLVRAKREGGMSEGPAILPGRRTYRDVPSLFGRAAQRPARGPSGDVQSGSARNIDRSALTIETTRAPRIAVQHPSTWKCRPRVSESRSSAGASGR